MAYTKRELGLLTGKKEEDPAWYDEIFRLLKNSLPVTEQETVDRLKAKMNKRDFESMSDRLDLEGLSAKITDMEDDPQDMLDAEGSFDSSVIDSEYGKYRTPDNSTDTSDIAKELSYSLEPEDQWLKSHVDAENKGKDLAREEHLLRRGAEDTSGGMTNNAFASKSPASKMSPQAKSAIVGLLKDFLTPAEDAPPQQARSAGISRGSIPFPSLLSQNKQPRNYYQNKGLV
jgi:hypothetical protein